MIIEDGIVKRKIRCVTENGYFQHNGFVEESNSGILELHKRSDDVKKIVLTHYPIKDNKDVLLLDNVTNYTTVRSLTKGIEKAIEWLSKVNVEGFNITIDDGNSALEVRDIKNNLLYILKV